MDIPLWQFDYTIMISCQIIIKLWQFEDLPIINLLITRRLSTISKAKTQPYQCLLVVFAILSHYTISSYKKSGWYIYICWHLYIYTCIHMNPLLVIDPHSFDLPKKSPRRRFTLLKIDVGAWRGAMDASRSHLHGQLLRLLPVLNGGVYWYGGTHRCPFPIGRLINRGVCLPL